MDKAVKVVEIAKGDLSLDVRANVSLKSDLRASFRLLHDPDIGLYVQQDTPIWPVDDLGAFLIDAIEEAFGIYGVTAFEPPHGKCLQWIIPQPNSMSFRLGEAVRFNAHFRHAIARAGYHNVEVDVNLDALQETLIHDIRLDDAIALVERGAHVEQLAVDRPAQYDNLEEALREAEGKRASTAPEWPLNLGGEQEATASPSPEGGLEQAIHYVKRRLHLNMITDLEALRELLDVVEANAGKWRFTRGALGLLADEIRD